jgi:hypothetical protein
MPVITGLVAVRASGSGGVPPAITMPRSAVNWTTFYLRPLVSALSVDEEPESPGGPRRGTRLIFVPEGIAGL